MDRKDYSTSSKQSWIANRGYRILIFLAYLVAGTWPVTVGVVKPGITGYDRCLLEDMVSGTAHRPFVKRQLVPSIIRMGICVTPESINHELRVFFLESPIIQRLDWPASYAPEFSWAFFIMCLSSIGFLFVLQKLINSSINASPLISHCVAITVGLTIPVFYAWHVYIYDFTQLLLFTSAILYMSKQQWRFYYPILILACFNKETSILLPFVFACWKGRDIWNRENRVHLAAQTVIAAMICGALMWIYRDNPGSNAEWHLVRNLSFQFPSSGWIRLSLLLAIVILSIRGMGRVPTLISRGACTTFPVLFFATLPFGYLDETRDYFEALPFGVCCVTATAVSLINLFWGSNAGRAFSTENVSEP